MPTTYSIYEAKAKLSEIVRLVKLRRSVTITERGKPVAQVVPIALTGNLESRIAELESSGEIQRGHDSDLAHIGAIAKRPGALDRFLATRERPL